MNTAVRILLVEDNPGDVDLIRDMLTETGSVNFSIESASKLSHALSRIKSGSIDVVLLDLGLPDSRGLDTFFKLKETAPDMPTIILTGNVDQETAVTAVREGAQDFLVKGQITGSVLVRSIRYALERKQSENALRESEDKFRHIFEFSNIGNSITLPSGEIEVNKAACEMVGYSQDELNTRRWQDITHPDDINLTQKVLDSLISGEKPAARFVKRFIHKNGSIVWADVSTSVRRDQNGKPLYYMSSIVDMTERKQMEEQVKTVAREWTESFDAINDMITIHDADFNIIRANKAAEKGLGLGMRDILTNKCYKSYHGMGCPPEGCPSCQTLKTGVSSSAEVFESHLNKYIEIKAMPRFGPNHAIIGVVHVVRDITERKKYEQTLVDYQDRIKLILDSAAEGIYGLNLEGNCTFCNMASVRSLGYHDPHELIGKNIHELIHHTKADGAFFPKEECIAHKAMLAGEYYHSDREPLWRKDGSGFPAEFWVHPILKNDVIQGTVVSFVDRTEHISIENQLRQAQKMEAIGTLAGGIAHDFNNILSAIIGYGHVILMQMAKDDPHRLHIGHMLESADRAAVLTQSLLTFSRKQVIDRKPVDLNKVLQGVEKFLVRVIGEDVEIRMVLGDVVFTVFADAGQLEQVFMNLATNARDAMPNGGLFTIESATVSLDSGFVAAHGYGKPGAYAVVSITDTGMGMSEEIRKKIFEPFFTTKEVGKGTGLGLAMVYGIIKQHEGFINVYSEPGKGTTFKIYLPLIKTAALEERQPVIAEYPKGGTETILLAEDDVNLRKLNVIVLEQMGYTVIPANDGEDAVVKFMENKKRIQLLLFDVIMPKKNGYEAYDEIKRIRPDIPVLFASGYSPDMLRQKQLIGEGVDIAYKPISPMNLLKMVRDVLDRK